MVAGIEREARQSVSTTNTDGGASTATAPLEISCPDCGRSLRLETTLDVFTCPNCRRELEIAFAEGGVVLVGAAPASRNRFAQDGPPADDPVLADLGKWQTGGVFALVIGAAGAILLGLAVLRDLAAYGASFFSRAQNLFIPTVLGASALLCLVGGVWVLYAVRKERQKYDAYIENKYGHRTRPAAVGDVAGDDPWGRGG